ncbi:thiamine pyrophosphate-binding protein [Mycobacterium sp. MBM]|nr:thiamine pyrophosphate-binding protein [Mycobacterium sp. MBM]
MSTDRSVEESRVRASLNGDDGFIAALESRSVPFLFNLPGTQTLSLLRKLAENPEGPRAIFIRHEQAAAYGAVGYAKVTGRPAVCLAVPGPGATNMLTGVASALADGIPLVVATPQVPAEMLGRGVLHDADLGALFAPTVKAVVEVEQPEDLGPALARAIDLSLTPRHGPVQLLFPSSFLVTTIDGFELPSAPDYLQPPSTADLDAMADTLASARKPVIWAGDRVHFGGARDALRTVAEALGAPVVTDEMARGVLAEDHPLAMGTASFREMPTVLAEADVCLAVGTAFPEWSTVSWTMPVPSTLLHLNDEAGVFDVNYPATATVEGDLTAALNHLAGALSRPADRDANWGPARVARAREDGRRAVALERAEYTDAGRGMHPHDVVATLRAVLPVDVLVCTDGSATGNWMSEETFPVLAGSGMLQSDVFKETGSALCAGMGAKLAAPDREVVVVQGDGGLLFQLGELASLRHNDIALTVVVFDDGFFNADRIYQEYVFGGRESDCALYNPDFAAVAAAFGLNGENVNSVAELETALQAALGRDTSTVIAAKIDPMALPYRLRSRIDVWKRRIAAAQAAT